MRLLPVVFLALVWPDGLATAREKNPSFTADDVLAVQAMLSDMQKVVTLDYFPGDKIGKEFEARCAETALALKKVQSNAEAYGLIADALASPDPRIRFYPPASQVRVDYSWKWQLIGDAAYVTEIDHEGDARKQGLQLGDKVLAYEGVAINRENYQSVYYVFKSLAPRPGLRVFVESPGAEPRWLAIAATVRPQRKLQSSGGANSFWAAWELSASDWRHRKEFYDLKQHLHRVGPVAVWRPIELERDEVAVADALKEIKSASALVLDLRGLYVSQHETAARLLDGLFADDVEVGVVKRGNRSLTDVRLRFGSGPRAFLGTVLVLVDAHTAMYAEVFARVIQQKQRGVIIGDYTMGRVVDETSFGQTRGASFGFATAHVLVPTGEVVMADGVKLDGKGVAPDLLLRPAPADLAGERDVVLAKALAMLKQKISPEDARKLIRLPSEDDDDNE